MQVSGDFSRIDSHQTWILRQSPFSISYPCDHIHSSWSYLDTTDYIFLPDSASQIYWPYFPEIADPSWMNKQSQVKKLCYDAPGWMNTCTAILESHTPISWDEESTDKHQPWGALLQHAPCTLLLRLCRWMSACRPCTAKVKTSANCK